MADVLPSNNPGTVLASAVDAEMTKFREVQASINQMRSDLQILLGQSTENEMVLQELSLLHGDDGAVVYKMIGPALIKQDLEDATQTVKKRLEFIVSERQKLSTRINEKERLANELAEKVQQMQSMLQQTTAQAVQAIAAQHRQC
jgi:prefoldin beta subunit